MISLRDITKGLEGVKSSKGYNTDLFSSDVEVFDMFSASDYDDLVLIATDTGVDKMKETLVCTKDSDSYLVAVTQQKGFNGEMNTSVFVKSLTLQGYNYFTKELEPNDTYYNMVLERSGYEITINEIKEIGVYNAQYNCTTLSFEFGDFKHWLTVNSRGQLSSIKKKPIDREVGTPKQSGFKSVLS